MSKSNPLEIISKALGGDDGLRKLRNVVGIPSFCYKSPIGWIDIIAEENRISSASFSEAAPSSEPTFSPTLPVLTRTIKLLDLYFAGGLPAARLEDDSGNPLWRSAVVSMARRSDRSDEISTGCWKRSRCQSCINPRSLPSGHQK